MVLVVSRASIEVASVVSVVSCTRTEVTAVVPVVSRGGVGRASVVLVVSCARIEVTAVVSVVSVCGVFGCVVETGGTSVGD